MKRNKSEQSEARSVPVPVTLPLVVATVLDTGAIQVMIDGTLLVEGPIDRHDLGRVLSAVADDKGTAIRAEIHEPGGRVFVDIISPPARRSRFAPPQGTPLALSAAPVSAAPAAGSPMLWEVSGEGFVPGEDVAVLAVVARTSAAGTGRARALFEQDAVPGGPGDVVLFGEISGTIVRQGPNR